MSKAIWKAVPNPETTGARWWIVEERDGSQHSIGTAGVEDDACVMAAAPDLLAALETVMVWVDNWNPEFTHDPEWSDDVGAVRDAIAKARDA